MTARLKIADGLTLPAELAGRRTAVFGISGSGKSNTAAVIVEQLLVAGEQVVMVDPKGEGWGLLSNADGKPSKLPVVVFGEPNGHIESLSESHGDRLADFVVESGRSVVLSLLGFESDQSERRFVATFLRQLYRRKSRQTKPTRTLVVLDEAHLFIPEGVRGDGAELAGAVQRIARQGRSFGLGTLLVDQRPQDVSKRVVTQCDTLVCHQLVHKTDRDALREWVRGYDVDGRGEQFLSSLAQLQPGEAWVWSPGWLKLFQRVTISRRKTFDSGAAPDGGSTARSVQRAEVDLEALRSQLDEVVEQAKANDPAVLKKRIAELERQLRERPADEAKVVEVPVLSAEDIAALRTEAERLEAAARDALLTFDAHAKYGQSIQQALDRIEAKRLAAPPLRLVSPPPARPVPAVRDSSPPRTTGGPPALGNSGRRRMMVALAQNPSGLTHTKLSILTGISQSGGTWRTYLAELRGRGFVADAGDTLRVTEAGLTALGDFDPLPTGPALLDFWRNRLGNGGKRRLFDVVVEAYPHELSSDEVAQASGIAIEGGTWRTYLAELRGLELIVGRGSLKANPDLFS